MPTLFNVDIAGILNTAMGPLMLAATLTKTTPGTRTAGSLGAGTNPQTADYAARGFTESYADREIDGTLIKSGDRKISLFGASIASSQVPAPNDRITIESTQFVVVRVERDPAGALYTAQCRR